MLKERINVMADVCQVKLCRFMILLTDFLSLLAAAMVEEKSGSFRINGNLYVLETIHA